VKLRQLTAVTLPLAVLLWIPLVPLAQNGTSRPALAACEPVLVVSYVASRGYADPTILADELSIVIIYLRACTSTLDESTRALSILHGDRSPPRERGPLALRPRRELDGLQGMVRPAESVISKHS